MSYKVLVVSTMYLGSIESFYNRINYTKNLSYNEHKKLLIDNSTEFVASYNRTLNRIGIQADCLIVNDKNLQKKWGTEHGINNRDYKQILYYQIKEYEPEILWIEDLNIINDKLLKNLKNEFKSIKLLVAYHCTSLNSFIIDKLTYFDLVIACTPGIQQILQDKGIRSYLVYHGFELELLEKVKTPDEYENCELVFCGSLFLGADSQNKRLELIEEILKQGVDISLYLNLENRYRITAKQIVYNVNRYLKLLGSERLLDLFPLLADANTKIESYSRLLLSKNKSPLFGIDMYKILNKSGITLNMHGDGSGEYAGNMRLFEATGVGSCLLTDKKKNLGELFEIDNEIVTFSNKQECIEKIKWLLYHKDERGRIGMAGQKRTLLSHTVESRCKLILSIFNEEIKKYL